jgi:hypothetical protein
VPARFEGLFQVEQIRLYKCDAQNAELFALVLKDGRPREVRLPVSASSLAGYTAMSQIPFILKSLDFKRASGHTPEPGF